MLEVDPIYLILLTEGFALVLLALIAMLAAIWFRRRQRCAVIADLTSRLKTGSPQRQQRSELFLQAAYNLDGDELRQAVQAIELRETEFLQQLITVLYRVDRAQLKLLDLSLETMIESYKHLEPRAVDESVIDPLARQVEDLLEQNEGLREELSLTKNTMSQMVAEFAEMFGGGQGHELTLEQVKEKVLAARPGIEFVESESEVQK